jgi:fumarate reductase flavoprotein subunit
MSFVTTALSPSVSLFAEGAILVNKHGERFCDERDQPAFSVADQPDKIAYIIIDGTIAKKFSQWPHFISTAPGVAYAFLDDYRRNRSDIFTRSNSPEELSNKLVFRNGALVASIDKIKLEEGDHKFDRGPYIALGPVRSVFVLADGGLAVDQSHRVLGAGDKPIEGLFAAGSTGQGGLLLRGHGHHLGWAFSSGRRAGRNAAFAATTANLGEQ